MAGFLRPGGTLRLRDVVYSFAPHEAEAVFEAWLSGAAPDTARGWTRPELETHIREEYSTFSWLLEPMLERAGLSSRASSMRRRGSIRRIRAGRVMGDG
jgi:hypothetical protein